jgi:hypothetical protein
MVECEEGGVGNLSVKVDCEEGGVGNLSVKVEWDVAEVEVGNLNNSGIGGGVGSLAATMLKYLGVASTWYR